MRHVRPSLSQHIFRIEFDAVLFEQREKFRFEGHFSVVCFLRLNVSNYGGDVGLAHTERGVALLPGEFFELFMGPAGGIRFDCANGLCYGQNRRNPNEQVNVIVHATNRVDEQTVVLANSCGVGPQAGLEFLGKKFATVFGAEHEVERVLGIRVGHCVAPTALGLLYHGAVPTLAGWASF